VEIKIIVAMLKLVEYWSLSWFSWHNSSHCLARSKCLCCAVAYIFPCSS